MLLILAQCRFLQPAPYLVRHREDLYSLSYLKLIEAPLFLDVFRLSSLLVVPVRYWLCLDWKDHETSHDRSDSRETMDLQAAEGPPRSHVVHLVTAHLR